MLRARRCKVSAVTLIKSLIVAANLSAHAIYPPGHLLAVSLNDKSYASDGTCDEKVEKSSLHTAAAASKKETSSSMPIEDGDDIDETMRRGCIPALVQMPCTKYR
jgi:hypothetical protein